MFHHEPHFTPHSMWMIMVVKIVDSLTTLYYHFRIALYLISLTSFPAFPCANECSCVSTICVKLFDDSGWMYDVISIAQSVIIK